eukprot:267016_1
MAQAAPESKSNDASGGKQKIVVCGGGNAVHVFVTFAASNPLNEVHVLSLYKTEAKDFETALNQTDGKQVTMDLIQAKKQVKGKPFNVTNDPKCLAGADMIIISLPAFAHAQYLTAIKENLGDKKRTIVTIFPGGWGLELQFKSILGGKADDLILLTGQDLPWACRIKAFGQHVEVLGTKQLIGAGVLVGKNLDESVYTVEYVFNVMKTLIGAEPVLNSLGHVLAMSLSTNIVVHPAIMHGYWSKWDGKPLKEKPLFYQGLSEEGAQTMITMSDEIIAISDNVVKYLESKEIKVQIKMEGIFQWYKDAYTNQASDISTLYKLIQTNKAYDGLTHPCVTIKADDDQKTEGFGPNYNYRYLTEDLPFGLVVVRGYSLLLPKEYTVKTPVLDKITLWCQKVLKKEYFVADKDGIITGVGKDINSSRSPQAYGFTEINQAIN